MKYAIRPRRYADQLDAIFDALKKWHDGAERRGEIIDIGRNPNGKYELLTWSFNEIVRLREKCGEVPKPRKHKIIPGRRPKAETIILEMEGG